MEGQHRIQHPQRRHAPRLFEALESRRLLSTASSESLASDDVVLGLAATLEASADSGSTTAAATSAEAAVFAHPSILHTEADFDRMRQKVDAGAQPWAAGFNALISDGFSQTGWNPR